MALACVFVLGSIVQPTLLVATAAPLLVVTIINRRLYAFFIRQGGIRFGLVCFGLHAVYYLYSGLSYVWVWLEYHLPRIVGFRVCVRPQPVEIATASIKLKQDVSHQHGKPNS